MGAGAMTDTDSYDAASKVIPSIKAGREHACYEIGISEGRRQSRDERDGWQNEATVLRRQYSEAEAEVDRMRHRLTFTGQQRDSLQDEYERMREGLQFMRDMPFPYRDPDGNDCYADTVRLWCDGLLEGRAASSEQEASDHA